LTAIILNLILDNNLNDSFNIDELVDVLFSFDYTDNSDVLSKYINIYENSDNSSLKN
jgi:hypothetical protein